MEKAIEKGIFDSLAIQRMLKEGKSPDEIAEALKIKKSTILKLKKMLEAMN